MKKFLRFLFFSAVIGALAYAVKQMMDQDGAEGAGSGVLPVQPLKSFEDTPLGGEVSPELLKILVCPEDKGSLELVENGKYLLNPRNGYRYPVRNGIPVMLIEEGKKNREPNFVVRNGAA
jgi:uncharacterized protein YbaR (Trm112 family)